MTDRTLSGDTTSGQSGPGSNSNERAHSIPQSSGITGASPSDCLVSYPGQAWERGGHPLAKMQSVYSAAPVDWAWQDFHAKIIFKIIQFSYLNKKIKCGQKVDDRFRILLIDPQIIKMFMINGYILDF